MANGHFLYNAKYCWNGINSQIIYVANNPETKELRRNILRELANGLIRPHLEARATMSSIPSRIKSRLQDICGINKEFQPKQLGPGRCSYCSWKKIAKLDLLALAVTSICALSI